MPQILTDIWPVQCSLPIPFIPGLNSQTTERRAFSRLRHIALLVMEGVFSICPDIFQGANIRVIRILLLSVARLPLGATELASVPLDGGLPALAWYLHRC